MSENSLRECEGREDLLTIILTSFELETRNWAFVGYVTIQWQLKKA